MVIAIIAFMTIGSKHSLPGFELSLGDLRADWRARALIQESVLEKDDELSSIFELVDKSLSEALEAFSAFDNTRADKLRRQMESLAQSARDLLREG